MTDANANARLREVLGSGYWQHFKIPSARFECNARFTPTWSIALGSNHKQLGGVLRRGTCLSHGIEYYRLCRAGNGSSGTVSAPALQR
jgi:hypothetical protein